MSGSGLAAVHAAASTIAAAAASGAAPAGGAPLPTAAPALMNSAADLASVYPELCATIRAEGAAAERARISGIEAHALPGHDALIASMKADGNVTPDMAAGRILAAEKAARGTQLQAIKDVETATGAVAAAPTTAVAAKGASETATTPDGWKAEYAASTALQSEFASADDYVALKKGEAAGKVRVLGARK